MDYGSERFDIMKFKYKQIAEHRRDSDYSKVHVVHDPEEEKKEATEENKRIFVQTKSRYYLLTQRKMDDNKMEFRVKQFAFDITNKEKPEPENCSVKKDMKLDFDSEYFDLKNK